MIDAIKSELPVYHTCNETSVYGYVWEAHERNYPYLLRDIYKELVGDASADCTMDESELDKRLREALENEDPDIVDLRDGRTEGQTKYDIFWKKCEEFLQECTAISVISSNW